MVKYALQNLLEIPSVIFCDGVLTTCLLCEGHIRMLHNVCRQDSHFSLTAPQTVTTSSSCIDVGMVSIQRKASLACSGLNRFAKHVKLQTLQPLVTVAGLDWK